MPVLLVCVITTRMQLDSCKYFLLTPWYVDLMKEITEISASFDVLPEGASNAFGDGIGGSILFKLSEQMKTLL